MAKKRTKSDTPKKSGPAQVLDDLDRVSLAPVEFEDALKALLATPPAPNKGED